MGDHCSHQVMLLSHPRQLLLPPHPLLPMMPTPVSLLHLPLPLFSIHRPQSLVLAYSIPPVSSMQLDHYALQPLQLHIAYLIVLMISIVPPPSFDVPSPHYLSAYIASH